MFLVKRIDKKTANSVVSNKHYSKKLGIFWEGFGLFKDNTLVGVCCFGQPSAPIQKHAFNNRDFRLYELTRLVVDSGIKNGASMLISGAINQLSVKPCAIISYADTLHGHSGIVYQATNWYYTGSTLAHDSLYIVNGENLHPMTIRDKFGVTNISQWAKENNIQKVKPKEKHRYFYFVGSKIDKKNMLSKLNYGIITKYPKSAKSTYVSNGFCSDYI